MHLPVLAKSYVDSVRIQIEATSRNPVKAAMGRKLIDADRYLLLILRYMSTIILTCICYTYRELRKAKLNDDAIWNMLKTEMPTQDHKKRAYFIHGMGSLFNMMIATEGYAIVAKSAFINHCVEVDEHSLGKFAEFASYCFRLRMCDNDLVSLLV